MTTQLQYRYIRLIPNYGPYGIHEVSKLLKRIRLTGAMQKFAQETYPLTSFVYKNKVHRSAYLSSLPYIVPP